MADTDSPGNPAPPAEPAADSTEKPAALSCLKVPSYSEACGYISSRYSCLVVKTHRRHIALPPKYLHRKRTGIKEHLDAELLKYSVVMEGVPVAYDNIKLIGELGDIFDDIGYIHINIEADFVIFQPQWGERLVGIGKKKAPSHIGCLVHGCFNASVPRPPKMSVDAWQLVDVTIGDELEFEVFRLDSDAAGVFCIRGRIDKKKETEAIEKLNALSKEQNANVENVEVENSTETTEEGAVEENSVLSGDTSKKKNKKRLYEETLSQNECIENQEDTNLSLMDIPKKKKKREKHKHQEALSHDHSVEFDGSGDNSATLQDSLQNIDVSLDSQHRAKKSKKKKHKDQTDLESREANGITEDSLITDDSILDSVETEPETTKKKHKKKHRNTSMILDEDPSNGIITASSQETSTGAFNIHQEIPKVKKPKKKHREPVELGIESSTFLINDAMEDSNISVSQHKVKKRKKSL